MIKLTKEEKQHIIIWRLVKKVSFKHGENYYSIDINPKQINKNYYLPIKSHNNFETAEETIKSLKILLEKDTIEYKMDIEGIIKKLAKLKQEKSQRDIEISELEIKYNELLKKLEKK